MQKYEFKLLPAYSQYSKIQIIEQNGSKITFLIPYYEKRQLKQKLKNAFSDYLNYVRNQTDCPETFKKQASIHFRTGRFI